MISSDAETVLGGHFDQWQADLINFALGAFTMLLGLVVVGVLVRLGIKWTRRAGKAIG